MRISFLLNSPRSVGATSGQNGLSLILGVLTFLLSFVTAGLALLSTSNIFRASEETRMRVIIPSEMTDWTAPLLPLRGIRTPGGQSTAAKVLSVRQILLRFPGVIRVEPVQESEIPSSFPAEGTVQALPSEAFPQTTVALDVFFPAETSTTSQDVQASLQRISSDIQVESVPQTQKLNVRSILISVNAVLLLGLILVVALVTRSALRAAYATLDTLRLMGAQNGYVAKIFQGQILRAAIGGGLIGVVCVIPTLWAFFVAIKTVRPEAIVDPALLWRGVGMVTAVPVIVALISVWVSNLTVLQHLRKLDRL